MCRNAKVQKELTIVEEITKVHRKVKYRNVNVVYV